MKGACQILATLVLGSCARPGAPPDDPGATSATGVAARTTGTSAAPRRLELVPRGSAGIVSPDDRTLVRPVVIRSGDVPALAVHALDAPAAPPTVATVGQALHPVRWLDATRVLARSLDPRPGGAEGWPSAEQAVVVDLGGVGGPGVVTVAPLGPWDTTRVSDDGTRAATVRDGAGVVLDVGGAERARLAPLPDGRFLAAIVGWLAADRLIVARASEGLAYFDAATGALRHDARDGREVDDALPIASASGRYVAHAVDADSLRVRAVDTRTGRPVADHGLAAMEPGTMAFSPDESTFITSVIPDELEVTHLATGASRVVKTLFTSTGSDRGHQQFIRDLGVTPDGRRVCGRVAASPPRYGECAPRLLHDASPGAALRADAAPAPRCDVRAGVATVVRVPAPRPPRVLAADMSSAATHTCRRIASANLSVVAVVETVAPSSPSGPLVGAELIVHRTGGGELLRLPLSDAATANGAALLHLDVSPTGRFVLLQLEDAILVADVDGRRFMPFPAPSPFEGAPSFSARESLLVSSQESCFAAVRLPGGQPLTIGCEDSPPATRTACLVEGEVAPCPP